MDCIEYKKIEQQTFITCSKFYLELENNLSNMYDVETGTSKEIIDEMENLRDSLNLFLNKLSKSV